MFNFADMVGLTVFARRLQLRVVVGAVRGVGSGLGENLSVPWGSVGVWKE